MGNGLGYFFSFVDVDFGGGDAAAVDLFDFEGGVEVECGYGFVEDLGIDSGVDKGSEKHVAGDAGEAVEIDDAHGSSVFFRCVGDQGCRNGWLSREQRRRCPSCG